jgi:hypothetical protein
LKKDYKTGQQGRAEPMKNLKVIQIENGLSFKLYDTVILTKTAENVSLSYGEFKTKTTFKALNAILENLSIPLKVFIKHGIPYVKDEENKTVQFENGITFDNSGKLLEAVTV